METSRFQRGAILRVADGFRVVVGQDGPEPLTLCVTVDPFDDDLGPRRSDVGHSEFFLPTGSIIRCHRVKRASSDVMPIGRVSAATLAAIDAAMAREVRAAQFEQRHTPDKHTERCVKL